MRLRSIARSAFRRLGYEVHRLPPPQHQTVYDYARWPIERLRAVVIGTTSICNASCVHCPTNKEMTRQMPKKVMPWEIFEKAIRGIREMGAGRGTSISFGLFAEPLLDPLVVRRAAFTREMLPDVLLNLNTNGGPLTPELARSLGKYADVFSVHIESIDPALYHELMYPLRAEDVFPKVEMLIRECGRTVNISYPVHKKNLHEVEELKEYWLSRGASGVFTSGLFSRCTDSLRFRELATGRPRPTECRQENAADLIIDWDGAVLPCCNDFLKRKPIGDLKVETVPETLASAARKEFSELMRDGRWDEVEICKDCYYSEAPRLIQIAPRA